MDFLNQDYQYYLDMAKAREQKLIRDAAVFRDICAVNPRKMLCNVLFAVGNRIIRIAEHIDAKDATGRRLHRRQRAA